MLTLRERNIEAAVLAHQVQVVVGTAVQSLQKLVDTKTEPFDLVFIDADKGTIPRICGCPCCCPAPAR